MASAAKKKKGTVSKKHLSNGMDTKISMLSFDDDGDVILLKCKICTVNINEIRKEAKTRNIRGNVLEGLLSFVDRVKGAHRGNFMRHIKGGWLHDWTKTNFSVRKMNCGSDQNEPSTSTSTADHAREKNQRTI